MQWPHCLEYYKELVMSEPTVAFDTKVGETYFEYERKDNTRFLSIIAWHEWDLEQYGLEFICKVVWNG